MSKNPRQKQKLLYLQKIMLEQTDETHGLTVNELIDKLAAYGISAERKSVYDDLAVLEYFGCDICRNKGKTVTYCISGREFELVELKLLVDAIQSSKFITAKKSNELIQKIESLTSVYQARLLQRQVYVTNRVKTVNERIYYTVDKLHEAISMGRQITFLYYEWTLGTNSSEKIVRRVRRSGEPYRVSPWALSWDDENYYLVAFDGNAGAVRHYRVDKMDSVCITDEPREGAREFDNFDMAAYSKRIFGMYGGEQKDVKIKFADELVGVVADRFGKDVFLTRDNDGCFTVSVRVVLSPQFFGWLFALGDKAELIYPKTARESFCEYLGSVSRSYS